MYEPGYGNDFGPMMIIIWLAIYFYFAFSQFKIAQKLGHHSPWYAFIPIVNVFQQIKMAGKDWWWFILYLVPIVNIFAIAMVWIEIAKACHKSPVWGVLMILPFTNLVAPAYLAFSDSGSSAPPYSPPPRQPEKVE